MPLKTVTYDSLLLFGFGDSDGVFRSAAENGTFTHNIQEEREFSILYFIFQR